MKESVVVLLIMFGGEFLGVGLSQGAAWIIGGILTIIPGAFLLGYWFKEA